MSEYLSKEEIKQWRSSLEKITLEEFAARLGKKLEEEKQTNDLVDIVLKGSSFSSTPEVTVSRTERISSIAEKSIEKEHQIIAPKPTMVSAVKEEKVEKAPKAEKAEKVAKTEKPVAVEKPKKQTTAKKEEKKTKAVEVEKPTAKAEPVVSDEQREDVQIVFKKALTDREQLVFDFFVKNKNKIVYAKDLAQLLGLPRDYVYKYIKNLRAKIDGENLRNADSGGFLLSI